MIFENIFNKVWDDCDKLCVGHSDYWNKMRLRVREKLEKELEVFL